MKAIIFDFDGVIHNTVDFHKDKIKEFSGVELSDDEFRNIHNGNFFANTVDKIRDIDWSAYKNFIYHGQSNLKIEEEMKKALLELRKNHALFIVSSGGTKNILDYLKNNGIAEVFQEVLGMDAYRSKIEKFNFIFAKHKLNSGDCIFITDTLGDILEANTVNMKTIAVDFGVHNKEILSKGNPLKIVSSVAGLVEAIEQT